MLNDLETMGYCEGDCDDVATLGGAMFRAAGLPSRLTAIRSANPMEFDHVFSEARIGEFWIPCDPTVEYGTTYNHYGLISEYV